MSFWDPACHLSTEIQKPYHATGPALSFAPPSKGLLQCWWLQQAVGLEWLLILEPFQWVNWDDFPEHLKCLKSPRKDCDGRFAAFFSGVSQVAENHFGKPRLSCTGRNISEYYEKRLIASSNG